MRYIEWIILFILSGIGTMLANYIGYDVGFFESLPGLLILIGIGLIAVLCVKFIPFKLPIVAYCSLLGFLLGSPLNPFRDQVIMYVTAINFTAPFSMVGVFAGMSISNQLNTFLKQGWKILIVALLVIGGAFLGSVIWSELLLNIADKI